MQMQKLRGIDGELDSESNSSNRLAHRRTIHMLEKNRAKKRAIGTLDVAFKKRFFALSGAGGEDDTHSRKPAGKNVVIIFLAYHFNIFHISCMQCLNIFYPNQEDSRWNLRHLKLK